jgi:hypothetical protein
MTCVQKFAVEFRQEYCTKPACITSLLEEGFLVFEIWLVIQDMTAVYMHIRLPETAMQDIIVLDCKRGYRI